MQNRAISDAYRIEYAPFEDLFRDQPRLIHWAVNQPLPDAIQDLHHHDALEVGYCREGAGIFIIDGEVLPFSAPCATVIYPGQLHKACSIGEPASRWLFITFRAQGLFGGDTGALARLPWNGPAAAPACRRIMGWSIWRGRPLPSWRREGRRGRTAPAACWPPCFCVTRGFAGRRGRKPPCPPAVPICSASPRLSRPSAGNTGTT